MSTYDDGEKYIVKTYNRYPVVFKSAAGYKLIDENNREYIDFNSGIAVSSLGHGHLALTNAISSQALLLHVSNLYYNKPNVELAKKLVTLSGMKKAFFCNSGAEANESAIKLARKYSSIIGDKKKNKIISMSGSFHGRTIASLTATGQSKYRKGFSPLLPGFEYCEYNNMKELANKVDDSTIAVIVEVIQGEGGIIPVNKNFYEEIRILTEKYNALMIIDEVQTGIGRTGEWFGFQQFKDIQPDAVTLAKGLAGGVPIGCMLVNESCSETLQPGEHASTFGGNYLSSAAALAVLNTIENDNLLQNVKDNSEYLFKSLSEIQKEKSMIKDIRGKGFLIGIELDSPSGEIVNKLLNEGILTVPAGPNVLRLAPPLIMDKSGIDLLLDKLRIVL